MQCPLALWLDGPEAGRRYAARYLALRPTDASVGGIWLVDQLMRDPGLPRQSTDSLLRDASASALRDARAALRYAADSTE